MDEAENKILGELLFELARGNLHALEEIAKRIEPILLAIGNRCYYNYADVEDAVHRLYAELIDKAKKFKDNANACAWIIKSYKNLIKMDLRKRKRDDAFLNDYETSHLENNRAYDDSYIERHVFLKEITATLTEEEIDLLEYHYWCKATVRELAVILGKPKSTVQYKCKKLEEKLSKLH